MHMRSKPYFIAYNSLMKTAILVITLSFLLASRPAMAQHDSTAPLRIAVLAPLYLDSAFDETDTYKLGNTNIPKYFLPGLEFYHGVMAAVDSLQKTGINASVYIYDTRQKGGTAESIAKRIESDTVDLILASFTNATEQRIFSGLSLKQQVPLVSCTYPNDAYVNANPNFVLINSSLRTHIEGIYRHLQRNYPIGRFIYLTRKGTQEDRVFTLFTETGKKTAPISYTTIQLNDDFTTEDIEPLLDSNRQNVIICGSLDENFGATLLRALDQTTSYQLVVSGMPTWDGMKTVAGTTNQKMTILYTTPYNYPRKDKRIEALVTAYKSKFNGRPSDMFFKGYETMYGFTRRLFLYRSDFLNKLQDNTFNLTNSFQFVPVKQNPQSQVPDYMENKKLYYITVAQGAVKSIQ